jgi:Na+/melibiose symporter-like transporter
MKIIPEAGHDPPVIPQPTPSSSGSSTCSASTPGNSADDRPPAENGASGLLQSSTYTALIIGPPLAAPLLFMGGVQWALTINAASFGISFLTIWLVRLAGAPVAAAREALAQSGRYWREFSVGLRFFAGSQLLLALAGGLILVALGACVLGALNVFFIQTNLYQSASLYGMIGLAEGIGGLLGGLMTGWIAAKIGALRMFWGGLLLAGIAIVGYSRMSNLFAALALMAAVGLLLGGVGASNSALLLAATPQHMIGRTQIPVRP